MGWHKAGLSNVKLTGLFIMEIFNAILKDHEKQRLLMRILVETSSDKESRSYSFKELK
jgi:hypothetical protein